LYCFFGNGLRDHTFQGAARNHRWCPYRCPSGKTISPLLPFYGQEKDENNEGSILMSL